MFALIVCSSFGRSNGWTLGSAFRTQIQLNWRESRDRKREHIAFRSFIEWYRGNACKTLPFQYICVYQRALRRVFFFLVLQYELTASFMRYWLRLACCLLVCAIAAFRCTLYLHGFYHCMSARASKKRVAFESDRLAGWLVGGGLGVCMSVCVALACK